MTTRSAASDAQLELLFEGLVGKNTYFPGELGPPMRVQRAERYTVINSSYKTDTFNLIISKRLGEDGPALIDRICGEFNASGLPAAWWTCEELREDAVPGLLGRHGFVEDEVDVGMIADLGTLPEPELPTGLEFKLVETPEEMVAFGQLIAALFEPPDAYVASFYERVAQLGWLAERPLKLFLGLLNGRPICTSSLYLSGEGAHLFDISTRADYRQRGYGSAITHFSLAFARKHGAKVGALQAAPDGLNIYRKLGFRDMCSFRVYSNKRTVSRS